MQLTLQQHPVQEQMPASLHVCPRDMCVSMQPDIPILLGERSRFNSQNKAHVGDSSPFYVRTISLNEVFGGLHLRLIALILPPISMNLDEKDILNDFVAPRTLDVMM